MNPKITIPARAPSPPSSRGNEALTGFQISNFKFRINWVLKGPHTNSRGRKPTGGTTKGFDPAGVAHLIKPLSVGFTHGYSPLGASRLATPADHSRSADVSSATTRPRHTALKNHYDLQLVNSCPGGTSDNSPAFQRWDDFRWLQSPGGTAEIISNSHGFSTNQSQPSLRDSFQLTALPGVETPGYSQTSLRDETAIRIVQPNNAILPYFQSAIRNPRSAIE